MGSQKKAQTSHPQLHPPQQREGLGTSVAHRISSASGTSARGLMGAVGCRASGLGRQGHPAWSWPRCTCMYSGPQTWALALTKFAFPLPNNRTPHLRCTKGPSNSTTSEMRLSPSPPAPPEASHSSGCAQHAKAASLPPRSSHGLPCPQQPLGAPSLSPSFSHWPCRCWINRALSLGLPNAPAPQSQLHKLAPASPSGVLPAPTPIPRGLTSLGHDQVRAVSHHTAPQARPPR